MKKEIAIAFGIVLVIVAVVGGYIFATTLKDDSAQRTAGKQASGQKRTNGPHDSNANIIAVLGQSSVPSPPQTQNTPPTQATKQPQATKKSTAKISLPAGWKQSNQQTKTSPCDERKKQKITTFKKGAEKITIYENASPAGCGRKVIGDVNAAFKYDQDGSVKLVEQPEYPQCTKEQNSMCPRDDGKVAIFVENVDPSTNLPTVNPHTNKTYAFRIDDSALDSDLDTQIKSLLKLVNQITFTYN